MKRNENLVPLSHEHHHGLLFCSRLKKAKNTDKETIVNYITDFYSNVLKEHLDKEETALLHLLTDENLKTRFLNDHQIIHKMMDNVNATPEDIYDQALAISQFITNHIRFEERSLFPWIEANATAEQLFSAGNDLNIDVEEVEAHAFEPEFWEK
ncbi:hypothetical protein EI427_01415 [Flammeovirga pectinis]|uniref:Uncharacterized protein n=1 Tax=Flammeovirga pectinis TaxID=2494373 RepID=A0A3Q9FN24_9BACT|nr:hemerythrin domain-containing protein [Flammeovirga pectinis]AZQ60918.1 hypothetical protein EI427_01415 [Flammeovirga pectinis]